jgi:long-chain acyl-CoA synthetase
MIPNTHSMLQFSNVTVLAATAISDETDTKCYWSNETDLKGSSVYTIDALLKNSSRKHSGKPALRCKVAGVWQETTYQELDTLSDRIAAGIIQTGLKKGDKAAIIAPSSPHWVAAYFGILKAGMVVVPVDKELKKAELRHILSDCDAKMIFIHHQHLETLLEIRKDLPLLDRVIMLHTPQHRTFSSPATAKALQSLLEEWQLLVASLAIPIEKAARLEALAGDVLRLFTGTGGEGIDSSEGSGAFAAIRDSYGKPAGNRILISLEMLLRDESPFHHAHKPEDTALILYTSGTTGRSKGAMLSHANIVANSRDAVEHFGLDSSIHTLSFLPINHVFEQVCGILLPLSLGGTVSFAESLKKLGENLAEVKPTFFLGVPAVYRLFFDRIMKSIRSKPLSKLLYSLPVTRRLVTSRISRTFGSGTTFISGGAALDPVVAKGLSDLGLIIYQGYGITETSPVISAESSGRTRLGTVGQVIGGVCVRIEKPNTEGIGEILVKGSNVMQGYYKNPQATDEALTDGWYRTGDLGTVDADGFLTICGRVKNLIVTSNGKNVYPEEIELELLKSPFISEAMVYGHKIDATTEEVHAIIYANQEALDDYNRKNGAGPMTEAEVEGLIRAEVHATGKNLADYKRIKKFTLREDEFPKTTTRKIKRFAVEADIAA